MDVRDQGQRIRKQARPALLWTLFFFLVGHLLVGWRLHCLHPEFFYPEYALRLARLSGHASEGPARPFALLLGSSRMVFAVRPQSVMEQAAVADAQPILFNYGLLGVGTLGERIVLHRLLHQGLKPKIVFVEVWPPLLTQNSPFDEERNLLHREVQWPDLLVYSRLYPFRWEPVQRALAGMLAPVLDCREAALSHYAPAFLPRSLRDVYDNSFDVYVQSHLDAFGWVNNHFTPHPLYAEQARRVLRPLFEHFALDAVSDQALRDLLHECRTNNVRVVFLLLPEHSLVRRWYASMQGKLLPYLRRLSEEHDAPIIDLRCWHRDEDLPDCCHLCSKAARAFSAHFGREVYRPLMEGRLPAKELLLRDAAP